jgi:glycosyltransferase involved in cell wall biosynthesis
MYEGLLPIYANNGTKLLADSFIKRLFIMVYGRITHPGFNEKESSLFRYFSNNKIELVLAEYGQTGATVINVVRHAKIPLIVHFHGHDAYNIDLLNRYKKKYQEMFAYASAIISVSTDMTEKLVSLGCPINKIIYNPYGPVKDFYSLTNTFEKKCFLAVGRFVEKKAPQLTLEAFKRVLIEHPDATLIMIGDGPLQDICNNSVKEWGIEKSVYFKGAIPQHEIKKYFSKCIAFVQHSITVATTGDSEGTPVAILEAGAAGLPVIATKHAGIKDVVIEGVTGYLVDELDTDSMSHYMIKLASDPVLAKNLGSAAKKQIYNNFNLERHISVLDQVIDDAINQKQKTN